MVERVVKNNLCTGCGLCASLFDKKVTLNYSKEGYIRPIQHQKLDKSEENLFKNTCPGLYVNQQSSSDYDIIWGPVKNITDGFSIDEELRFNGSSGGALSAFLYYLIQEKIVDYILHTGASITNAIYNNTSISENKIEILNKGGSRYSPSSPLEDILSHLKQDKVFAFVGKPCDIVGIRNLISENKAYENKIKVLISFMCAGIPSIKGTKEVLKKLNVAEANIKSLRYRGEGWPGNFKVIDTEDKEYKISYNESWGEILNKHLQFRCKICPDGTGELADIVFADSWEESSNGYPSFEEKPGISLIITRTLLGQDMLLQAINRKYIKINRKEINNYELEKIQPYQAERKKAILPRIAAMLLAGKSIPRYNWKLLLKATQKLKILRIIKNFLGMISRII